MMMAALVDLSDYKLSQQLSDSQFMLIGDLNGDGQVNNADLQSLISLVANSISSGAGGFTGDSELASVPEPVASSLMMLGSLGVLALHRRRC